MNYKRTIHTCFLSYVVQAIIINFTPLLFVNFNRVFNIPFSKITLLITLVFLLQLLVDIVSVKIAAKVGYRFCAVAANVTSLLGLVLMATLPFVMDPYTGLIIAVAIYSVGGGLLEVVISPIVEACPTDNKSKVMSLLHSFYSWGAAGVILISTLFFALFGVENWPILSLIWAIVPLIASILFLKVPIVMLEEDNQRDSSVIQLIKKPLFWLLFLLMIASGACEQAVAQWASTLTEQGLGVSKAVGDIAGPAMFAVCMAVSRTFYGKKGEKIDLKSFMVFSGLLSILSYLLISLSPIPLISLIGCALCGLAVGIMWPGTLSIASGKLKGTGAMFALLAVAGDIGCTGGPTFTGFVSTALGDNLKTGILVSIIFPVILVLGILYLKKNKNNS